MYSPRQYQPRREASVIFHFCVQMHQQAEEGTFWKCFFDYKQHGRNTRRPMWSVKLHHQSIASFMLITFYCVGIVQLPSCISEIHIRNTVIPTVPNICKVQRQPWYSKMLWNSFVLMGFHRVISYSTALSKTPSWQIAVKNGAPKRV